MLGTGKWRSRLFPLKFFEILMLTSALHFSYVLESPRVHSFAKVEALLSFANIRSLIKVDYWNEISVQSKVSFGMGVI